MLEIDDLSVRFGDTLAVDDVTLRVPTGAICALLGPSGSGKSTLLRAVAGLVRPTHGRISYDGRPLAGVPVHKRGFALMFQDGQLFEHQSVARNVGYALRLKRAPHRDRRVAQLLDLVGLPDAGSRMPSTLSGGERQRVALARALAVEPRLLLLDEPLSALDRDLREGLAQQLRRILAAAETTAIMVTHDQDEAFAVADHLGVMRAGRLVQHGPVADVWGSPADAWTAKFLGYASVLTGEQARRISGDEHPIALRRSALQVDPDGSLGATVLAVLAGPDQARLEIEVGGVGRLDAVAAPGTALVVGEQVRVSLDTTRVARIATHS